VNGRRLSRYWLLVPLIVAALLSRDWVERPDSFELEETVDMRQSEADYYLEDFTTRRFDASGALEYIVSGASLSHYPDDGRSEVETPRVELYRPGTVWRVAAERGRLDVDPDVFTLLGEVRLERDTADSEDGPLTLRTSDVTLALDGNELRTDAPFEIVAETWRLAGVGLRSAIDAGKLELLSNVNGTFDVAVPP